LALTASLIVLHPWRLSILRAILAHPIGLPIGFVGVSWRLSGRTVPCILTPLSVGWFLRVLPSLLRLTAIWLLFASALRLTGHLPLLGRALGTAWGLVLRTAALALVFAALL